MDTRHRKSCMLFVSLYRLFQGSPRRKLLSLTRKREQSDFPGISDKSHLHRSDTSPPLSDNDSPVSSSSSVAAARVCVRGLFSRRDRCPGRFFAGTIVVAMRQQFAGRNRSGESTGARPASSGLSPITSSCSTRPRDQGPAGGTRRDAVSRGLRLALSRTTPERAPAGRADRCARQRALCAPRVTQ